MKRRTGPTQAVRDLVFIRDTSCIVCGETYQLQVHHRRPRGAGGTSRPETNQPGNLVLLCLEHHAWVESNRDTARSSGYLVPQHADPQDVPLVRHGQWVWLCNDGTVTPLGATDLAEQGVTDQTLLGEQDSA